MDIPKKCRDLLFTLESVIAVSIGVAVYFLLPQLDFLERSIFSSIISIIVFFAESTISPYLTRYYGALGEQKAIKKIEGEGKKAEEERRRQKNDLEQREQIKQIDKQVQEFKKELFDTIKDYKDSEDSQDKIVYLEVMSKIVKLSSPPVILNENADFDKFAAFLNDILNSENTMHKANVLELLKHLFSNLKNHDDLYKELTNAFFPTLNKLFKIPTHEIKLDKTNVKRLIYILGQTDKRAIPLLLSLSNEEKEPDVDYEEIKETLHEVLHYGYVAQKFKKEIKEHIKELKNKPTINIETDTRLTTFLGWVLK